MRGVVWSAALLILAGTGGLLVQDRPEATEPPFEPPLRSEAPQIDAAPTGPASVPPAPEKALPGVGTGRLLDPGGEPVAGATVYRSDSVLGSANNTWQTHWEDRNRTRVLSDEAGRFPIPDGTGSLHVRADGFSPASFAAPDGGATWVLSPRPEALAVAHRGGAAHAPENTLAAIHTAALMGAPFVEIDVRLTRDQDPVVIHDPTLDRTTNGTGPVALAALWEVQTLDAGSWFHPSYAGERVPSLLEALQVVKRHRIGVVIELKMERAEPGPQNTDLPTDALVYRLVLDALHEANLTLEQTIISSFGQVSSHTCARMTASTCGWIVRRNETSHASASAMVAGLSILHLHRADADERVVAQMRATCDRFDPQDPCPRVFAYTVNKVTDMERLAAYVDGITSDDVEALMAVLGATG